MKMRNAVLFVFALVLLAGSVLAAGPSPPHAFYGEVKYSNGTLFQQGAIIAKISSQEAGASEILNGAYDLIVESDTDGAEISFYLQGKAEAIKTFVFEAFEITELDLIIGEEGSEDEEDDSDSGDSSSGGSSRSSSRRSSDGAIILNSNSDMPVTQGEDEGEISLTSFEQEEEQNGFFPTITGAVIGTLGKTGTVLISAIIIVLIIGLGIVVLKRGSRV